MEKHWAIYYADGSVRTDADCAWDDAPAEGVLLVVERIGDKTTFHMGSDYYRRFDDDGTIAPSDDGATILRENPNIKFGRFVSHTKMEATLRRARQEWGIE